MKFAFSFIDSPERSAKPRSVGVTMVLDKGMSSANLRDWLKIHDRYVDLLKLGWGTTAVMDRETVAEKCAALAQHGVEVCPGGTLFELAFFQGKLSDFLNEAHKLGFSCIEISNGTIPMRQEEKLDAIQRAIDAGFRVVSEVGFKDSTADHRLDIEQRIAYTQQELDRGAWKVIVEARESGTLGIFDDSGEVQSELLRCLIETIPGESLIFEAPHKHQQAELIGRLGNAVNLGNIAPQELISLETLRRGLRSDTFNQFHMAMPVVRVELGTAAAWDASQRGDILIIVDALRASTTIVTALANGLSSVRVVGTVEECVGELTAGERGGKKIPHLRFDNSPVHFSNDRHRGKELVLTSTNGAECVVAAASNPKATILVGALINARAVAERSIELARSSKRDITIVTAGRNNAPALEDTIAASEIVFHMQGTSAATGMPLVASDDFIFDFLNSDSGKNLVKLGRSEDVIFSARRDIYDVVPVWRDKKFVSEL